MQLWGTSDFEFKYTPLVNSEEGCYYAHIYFKNASHNFFLFLVFNLGLHSWFPYTIFLIISLSVHCFKAVSESVWFQSQYYLFMNYSDQHATQLFCEIQHRILLI